MAVNQLKYLSLSQLKHSGNEIIGLLCKDTVLYWY